MKDLLRYFPKSKLSSILMWILIEQGLVAFSTWALIRATAAAVGAGGGTDVNAVPDAVFWTICFLGGLSLPYLPGIFARRGLEDVTQIAYREFLSVHLPEKGGLQIWARRDLRESFQAGISSEAYAQIRQAANTVFDLVVILLNVTLNLMVLGYHFHPVIAAAFAGGTFVAYFVFRGFGQKVDQVSVTAQSARTGVFAHLQRAWDNALAAHVLHRRGYIDALANRLGEFRQSSVKAVTTSEVVSVLTTYAILLPVLAAVLGLLWMNPSMAFLAALLSTLPRQFQVIGNLQVLISYLTAMTALRAQARQVLSTVRIEPVATAPFVRAEALRLYQRARQIETPATDFAAMDLIAGRMPARGRLVLRGPNGAGKSSALIEIAARLDDAYFLPAHADYWTPGERRTGSTGQRLIQMLEFAAAGPSLKVLLLDEWDANLDEEHRARIDQKLDEISATSLVIEVRHHA